MNDIRDTWRVEAIERKVNDMEGQLYRLDEAVRDVASLEHTCRELSSKVDGLCYELEGAQRRIEELDNLLNEEGW